MRGISGGQTLGRRQSERARVTARPAPSEVARQRLRLDEHNLDVRGGLDRDFGRGSCLSEARRIGAQLRKRGPQRCLSQLCLYRDWKVERAPAARQRSKRLSAEVATPETTPKRQHSRENIQSNQVITTGVAVSLAAPSRTVGTVFFDVFGLRPSPDKQVRESFSAN